MARRKRSGRALVRVVRVGAPRPRRARQHYGSGRMQWGIEPRDAAVAAAAGLVGQTVQGIITRNFPNAPDIIKQSPVEALGLYVLGVLMRRPDWRDIGAGLSIGRYLGIGIGANVAP